MSEDIVTLLREPFVGLGCASFGGRVPADASRRVLEAAYESGVRYFDVARSYGYGSAETIVGSFLRDVWRESVTVATKVGIQPARMTQSGLLRRVAQAAAASSPAIRTRLRRFASRSVEPSHFTPAEMTDSFHQSLRALGVERVDVLHLHEIRPADLTDEVREWISSRVATGEVGTWGIATTLEDAEVIAGAAAVPVVQVPSPVIAALPPSIAKHHGAIIRHSVVRESIQPVQKLLSDGAARGLWENRVGLSLDPHATTAFLLRLALSSQPAGPVLAGTTRPEHAREFGGVVPLESGQVVAAQALVRSALDRSSA